MIVHLGHGGDAVKCSVSSTERLEWGKRCHRTHCCQELSSNASLHLSNKFRCWLWQEKTDAFLFNVDGISGSLHRYHDMKDHSLQQKDKA